MSIEFKSIYFDYNSGDPLVSHALKNINLEIEDHSFFALIGETGSGKTTLAQHLNGLLWPNKGTIKIDDFFIDGNDAKLQKKKKKGIKKLRSYCGMVFQFPEYQLFESTVLKDVMFGPKNFDIKEEEAKKIAMEALNLVGLDESYYERAPFELSGGEKRRAAIAGIIALKPKILVLDEPTAGLDPKGEDDIMQLFKKIYNSGTSIILVTHNMDIVLRYATKVGVMDHGELKSVSTPLELFQNEDVLTNLKIEPPKVFSVARSLIKNGLNIDLGKIKDVSSLAKEIARVEGKNE